jgi:hypothetical protein
MLPFLANLNWPELVLHLLLSAALLFVIFGTSILILIFINKLSRMDFSRSHTVRLTNGGNVRSVYQLLVEAPETALQFKLLINGIPLGSLPTQIEEPPLQRIQEAPPSSVSLSSGSKPVPMNDSKTKNANNVVAATSGAGKGIAEKSGALASLLGTVGSILPGQAGAALKEQGEAARNVQTKTSQTLQAPESAKNKMDELQRDSGKLGVKTTSMSAPTGGNGTHPVAAPERVQVYQTTGVVPQAQAIKPAVARLKPAGCHVETKEVAPGESLELILWIAPTSRRSLEGSFPYTIKSQQIPLEKLDREVPPVVSRGVVHFKPVAPWRYWLPSVLNGTIILMEVLSLVYFLTLIWL